MKKLFTLALSLTLCCGMLAFAACKKDNTMPQTSDSSPLPDISDSSSDSSLDSSSDSNQTSSDESSSPMAD